MKKLIDCSIFAIAMCCLASCSNPSTPAGYVGYVTQGAFIGSDKFYAIQTGPTSTGLGWLLGVTNVSITPYTFSEEFSADTAVLSKDNLKIGFNVHILWKINKDGVRDFIEHYSYLEAGDTADKIAKVAYGNYIREPLRTVARDQIQKLDALQIKDQITALGTEITTDLQKYTEGTPFEVSQVVVGNIQYPDIVANAVAEKMATTQVLQRTQMEVAVEKAKADKRVAEATGIAEAMAIIQAKLTPTYLQHEAIEAQKAMVNSPNHSVIYIPVGSMGVPITGTFDTAQR